MPKANASLFCPHHVNRFISGPPNTVLDLILQPLSISALQILSHCAVLHILEVPKIHLISPTSFSALFQRAFTCFLINVAFPISLTKISLFSQISNTTIKYNLI